MFLPSILGRDTEKRRRRLAERARATDAPRDGVLPLVPLIGLPSLPTDPQQHLLELMDLLRGRRDQDPRAPSPRGVEGAWEAPPPNFGRPRRFRLKPRKRS